MDPADRMTPEALQQHLEALDAHYQATMAHTTALARQMQQQVPSTGQDASDGPPRFRQKESTCAIRHRVRKHLHTP